MSYVVVVLIHAYTASKDAWFAAVSPFAFAPGLRRPTLMLMGTRDTYYSADEARRLLERIADSRKELFFYDSGHDLPAEWRTKAAEWIVKYLR